MKLGDEAPVGHLFDGDKIEQEMLAAEVGVESVFIIFAVGVSVSTFGFTVTD